MMALAQISAMLGFSNRFDADYQAILDRASSLGYTLPSSAQQTKQNQLVLDLKAASIWTTLDILYVFATDGGSDFASLNWKSPSLYEITRVSTPTFTTNQGFNGNASTSYLDTNFNQLNNSLNATQNLNSYAIGINSNQAGNDNKSVLGILNSTLTNGTNLVTRTAVGNLLSRNNSLISDAATGVNATRINNYIGNRTSSSRIDLYRSGVSSFVDLSATSQTFLNGNIFICGINRLGTGLFAPTDETVTHFAWGNLNGKESSFNTSWTTYFTSL